MTLIQTEPKAIKIGIPGGGDYSAMQGPCAEGYHVPIISEWTTLFGMLTTTFGLANNSTTTSTYLKMPSAGRRYNVTSEIEYQNSLGSYRSSTAYNDEKFAYHFYCYNSGTIPSSYGVRCQGMSIRPFKDTPITPDNSWTILYDGSGVATGAGIFHNATLGLISISADGINWTTIADKNLGATTVYNSGDTLSEANCGKYYQWGNNYGFPFTGSVTTSTTQVDASNYGPGNYYNNSTFINKNAWDSSDNRDLRGGETGVIQRLDTDIKAVYLGETKVRPPYKPRTFTITRTEQSDMSSGWTYSDDAAGLTAGDGAFDDFFGYSAVLLNTSGVETAEMKQSGGVFTGAMSTLGNITSGDNVMIKFPVRGIKMTKSGSTVTLSITDGLGRESEGYQYYAFQNTGDIEANASTTVATKPLYLGAYLSYNNSNTLKSWSGKSPAGYLTIGNCLTYSGNNGAGHTIMGWYQRCLINAYYMMKYGNPNSQSVVGQGYTGGSSTTSTGGTNSQTNATYGSTSGYTQMKLFGLEDRWGNQHQWVGGMFTDGSANMYTALHDFTVNTSTSQTQYKNAGAIRHSGNYPCLISISGTNKGMFGPNGTVRNSNYNTYYCDYASASASCFAISGGNYRNAGTAGAFRIEVGRSSDGSDIDLGSRLMYL